MQNLLTIAELCRWLNVSERHIYNLRKRGLPYLKLTHKITRYDVSQVETWLKYQAPQYLQETIGELGIKE